MTISEEFRLPKRDEMEKRLKSVTALKNVLPEKLYTALYRKAGNSITSRGLSELLEAIFSNYLSTIPEGQHHFIVQQLNEAAPQIIDAVAPHQRLAKATKENLEETRRARSM